MATFFGSAFSRRLMTGSVAAATASVVGVAMSVGGGKAEVVGTGIAAAAPRCRPVVLCGPSGAGKSTLIDRLRKEFPEDYGFSVSHTTRDPRPGEVDGIHYHFVRKDLMSKEIEEGLFLEHANVHGNLYGTSRVAVESVSDMCRVCILDIDIQGVKSCQRIGLDVDKYVFVAPPDMETLEKRLRGRGTETEERIKRRLAGAVIEMDEAKRMSWDAYIVNDNIDAAYVQLKALTEAGRAACIAARREREALASAATAGGEGASGGSGKVA